jgi:hypothetical protein
MFEKKSGFPLRQVYSKIISLLCFSTASNPGTRFFFNNTGG